MVVWAACASPSAEEFVRDYPVIDMHLHALGADGQGPIGQPMCLGGAAFGTWDQREPFRGPPSVMGCENTTVGSPSDEVLEERTFAILDSANVFGVTSGRYAADWRRSRPDRIMLGFLGGLQGFTPETLAERLDRDSVEVFAEITVQYRGLSPSAPELAPLFEVAANRDLPVGIHLGMGPPGSPMFIGLRLEAGNPIGLEGLLNRHPSMRVYAMHAGWPFVDEMIGMMMIYPQLHVSLGVLGAVMPESEFHGMLARMVNAGFEQRIMFGSDQMVWPEILPYQIRLIENAPFLSAAQKRAILFDNAVRFLRLEDDPRITALTGS